MSMFFPDLVIESIIRDGIEDLKANPEFIDDVFGDLLKPFANRKYGTIEIDKIKELLTNTGLNPTTIAVVHSYHEAAAKSPCYSIQLGNESEAQRLARLDDFEEDLTEPLSAPELASLVKTTGIVITTYDATSGQVRVTDGADLSVAAKNYIFVDGLSQEFVLQAGISNVLGDKYFFVPKQSDVFPGGTGSIKSFLTEKQLEIRGVTQNIEMLIGCHSKEALLTKYMYSLLQFFLLSRKRDMISRGLIISSLSGSDFTRDTAYEGDVVFARFLSLNGKAESNWRSDQVTLVDQVTIEGTGIDC